jgi:hypothetical protein
LKGIIDANNFRACPETRIKDAWEALIEIVEILSAGLVIMAKRQAVPAAPKSVQDRLWGIVERSPMAAAMIFLGVVALKIAGVSTNFLK